MIKSLIRLSLRMVTGVVQSLIKLCGLDWTAPDYSTFYLFYYLYKAGQNINNLQFKFYYFLFCL
jgi:hypothetical protein